MNVQPLQPQVETLVREALADDAFSAPGNSIVAGLLASLDEARAQRDSNLARAEEAVRQLTLAEEANNTLLRILYAVAEHLSPDEAAEVAVLAREAVRR